MLNPKAVDAYLAVMLLGAPVAGEETWLLLSIYRRCRDGFYQHCATRYETSPTRTGCDSKHYLSAKWAKVYIDNRLRDMLDGRDPNIFVSNVVPDTEGIARRLIKAENEINELQQQIQRMILKQASVYILLQDQYKQAILTGGTKLQVLKVNFKELQQQGVGQNDPIDRRLAFDEISSLTVDGFWDQPELVN